MIHKNYKQNFNRISRALFLAVYIFVSVLNTDIFAATTTNTNTVTTTTTSTTDLTQVGMNMFTQAYNWEVGNSSGYMTDAFKGFSKKLSTSIKKQIPDFAKKCGGCSTIVDTGFDDALAKFIRTTPPTLTNAGSSYYALVAPYLHQKIRESSVSAKSVSDLNTLIKSMVDDISGQVKEQMDTYRDVSGVGLYYDGDTTNSPYDLMEDIRRIDSVFFREAPEFGTYKNTSKKDASALITGQIKQGSWVGGGKNYDLNLLGDINSALGNNGTNTSTTSGSGNEVAGDCDSGYCVTVDFVQSTHYLLGGSSGSSGKKGNTSYQGIFEEALSWITKNGDKRNFACKTAPTFNFFQSENDQNLSLSKIFSGLGIFVIWKTPKFLMPYFNRSKSSSTKSNTTTSSSTSKTSTQQSQDDKTTEDALRTAFRARGIDYDRPTNIKGSTRLSFDYAGIQNGTVGEQKASDIAASVGRSQEYYQQILKENGAGSNRALVHEENRNNVKFLEKAFDDVNSRVRLLGQFSDDLSNILKYIKEKPECGNA